MERACDLCWADGCLTGFYLSTRGLTDAEALALTQESFAWMAEYDGDIPALPPLNVATT